MSVPERPELTDAEQLFVTHGRAAFDQQGTVIRARVIRELLIGGHEEWPDTRGEVVLVNAVVEGKLDLEGVRGTGGSAPPSLELLKCEIRDGIDVSYAQFSRLDLGMSRFPYLRGVAVRVDTDLSLLSVGPVEGSPDCSVDLSRSVIGGSVIGLGARLHHRTDGELLQGALSLRESSVEGRVSLGDGFVCRGELDLVGLQAASVDLGGAILESEGGGEAVSASLVTTRHLFCLNETRIQGSVSLMGALIGGRLECSDADISSDKGLAFSIQSARIGSDLLLAGSRLRGCVDATSATVQGAVWAKGLEIVHQPTAEGEPAFEASAAQIAGPCQLLEASVQGGVSFEGAIVGGDLTLSGGSFSRTNGLGLAAGKVRVSGSLCFGDAPGLKQLVTTIGGGLSLEGAMISGDVVWNGLRLAGSPDQVGPPRVLLSRVEVRGRIAAHDLACARPSTIDLTGASCGALDDHLETGWGGPEVKCEWEEFTFQRLLGDPRKARWDVRIPWIASKQATATTSPYRVLASLYARRGLAEDARQARLAMHRAQASLQPPSISRASSRLFDLVSCYGLSPRRITIVMLLFLLVGSVGVSYVDARGFLVDTEGGGRCGPAAEPTLFALDLAVPVLDLSSAATCEIVAAVGSPAGEQQSGAVRTAMSSQAFWRWLYAVYTIIGTILTSIGVITYTGIMQPRVED